MNYDLPGDISKAEVTIIESKEFKNTVDKLLVKANLALVVGTSSWKEQFVDALTVSGSGDDEESDEPTTPTYGDYMMHYLTVFWKLLFAIVPPTDIWGGWACFVASIVMIGLLTMVIGDVASHFGCTIGLADSVVAITFVALGTSLPGKDKTINSYTFVLAGTVLNSLSERFSRNSWQYSCTVIHHKHKSFSYDRLPCKR